MMMIITFILMAMTMMQMIIDVVYIHAGTLRNSLLVFCEAEAEGGALSASP